MEGTKSQPIAKTFRVNEDSAHAFREFCDKQGFNQAQGFDHLIRVLELNQAKARVPGRKTEIDSFEMHVKAVMDAYLHSIEISTNTEERIHEQYRSALDSKDKSILMLQEKVEEKEQLLRNEEENKKELIIDAEESRKYADRAKSEVTSIKELAAETKRNNEMLMSKLTEAEQKLKGYEDIDAELRKKDQEIQDLRNQTNRLLQELDLTKRNAEREKERSDISRERAITQMERKYSDQIFKYREELAGLRATLNIYQKLQKQDKKTAEPDNSSPKNNDDKPERKSASNTEKKDNTENAKDTNPAKKEDHVFSPAQEADLEEPIELPESIFDEVDAPSEH